MRINWKVRFRNKAWLMAFTMAVLSFAYQVLGMFGIVAPIELSELESAIETIVGLLVLLGVVIDPTTKGLDDSERAMGYEEPN